MSAGDRFDATTEVALANGVRVTIRPLGADDEPRLRAFHEGLSTRSVFHRYFHVISLEHRIAQTTRSLRVRADDGHAAALVAEHLTTGGARDIVALGRVRPADEADDAEIALVVMDAWQRLGLGTAMLRQLLATARRLGVRRVYGDMLADNDAMRLLVKRAGFVLRPVPGDAGVVRAELPLA